MSTVTIDTGLSFKQLEKDLKKAQSKVEQLKNGLAKKENQQFYLVKDLDEANAKLAEAQNRLKKLQTMSATDKKNVYAAGGDPNAMIAAQTAEVKNAQKAADKAAQKVFAKDTDIAVQNDLLKEAEASAAEYATELNKANQAAAEQNTVMKRVGTVVNGTLEQITHRVKGLMKRVLFFSVITAMLRSVRGYFKDMISQNAEATQAIANMKNAFATLAQPLVSAVIPAVVALANWITRVVTAVIQLIGLLTGKKLKDAQKATGAKKGGAGGGGNDKSLAGFDTLNQLSGGAGGGGAAAEMETVAELSELTNAEMAGILGAIAAIGAALIAWKLPFGGLSFFQEFAGILLTIVGLVIAVMGYMDAWNNGISFDNLSKIILGLSAALFGLYLLFGQTGLAIGLVVSGIALLVLAFKDIIENGPSLENILTLVIGVGAAVVGLALMFGSVGAAIGLVVAGIAVLILAFQDIMKNGTTLQNTVLAIIGIILTALGVFIKTGNPFALIIGLIAAVVFALVSAGGQAEELIAGLKLVLDGLIKFIKGVFTGDWELAWEGIKDIFKGIWNSILAIVGGVINAAIKGINWLISKLNTVEYTAPDWVPLVGGKSFGISITPVSEWQVPYLASGAVIPPNREFLAVLGDQASGTNIEAPLETIVEAFQRVQGGQNITINFTGDLAQLARVLNPYIKRDSVRAGTSLVGG